MAVLVISLLEQLTFAEAVTCLAELVCPGGTCGTSCNVRERGRAHYLQEGYGARGLPQSSRVELERPMRRCQEWLIPAHQKRSARTSSPRSHHAHQYVSHVTHHQVDPAIFMR